MAEESFKDTCLFSGEHAEIRTISSKAVEWQYPKLDSKEGLKNHYVHHLLEEGEAENKVVKNQWSSKVERASNMVTTWDVNFLPSGDTTEDRLSIDVLTQYDLNSLLEDGGFFWQKWWKARTAQWPTKKEVAEISKGDGSQDILMFSVFDGHGGPNVSELLKKTLHGCLAWNLAQGLLADQKGPRLWEESGVRSGLSSVSNISQSAFGDITSVMSNTISALDQHIIQTTHDLLFNPFAGSQSSSNHLPPNPPAALALGSLLRNGACALTAIVDVTSDKLYVANVGDTRAVAGWWNEDKKQWRCDILTEDAMAENPAEVERVLSEHPLDEANTAIYSNSEPRVLGGLQLTKAMGDEDYKIDHEEWKELWRCLNQGEPAKRWSWFDECPNKTPPYVSAKPEMAVRNLHPNSGEELKFVILATDGLWDRLTSEEAVYLAAAHLAHPHHEDIAKTQLCSDFPQALPLAKAEHPFPKEEFSLEGSWVFEDENSATHLLRNSLGGSDRELRRQFLSLRNPGVRAARDDITAIVIWFDESSSGEVELVDRSV